jgi:hypothetical protein
LTAIYAAAGDCEEAARLAGAAESIWESIGAQPHPADQVSTDRWLKPALEHADAAEMEIAISEGRAMKMMEAVRYALGLPEKSG